jgi:hypothetical protein
MSRPPLLILRPLVLAVAIPIAAAACIAWLGSPRQPPRGAPAVSPVALDPPRRADEGLANGDAASRARRTVPGKVDPEGVTSER